MEIILSKEDIEHAIKQVYRGVNEVLFSPEEVKVTLKVDGKLFFTPVKKSEISMTSTPSNTSVSGPKDPEEKYMEEARLGKMASGGADRLIQHIG